LNHHRRLLQGIFTSAVALFCTSHPFPTAQRTLPTTGPTPSPQASSRPASVFGFRDFAREAYWDAQFMAVPDPALARQHLKILTSAPHWASSPEDYATAQYVAAHFKAAGLETEIVPYSVLMNKPLTVQVEAYDAAGQTIFSGPAPEHVTTTNAEVDRQQNDPRVLPPFNDSSPDADLTAGVVYANYGRITDYQRLAKLGIAVKDRIVLVRYGGAYRGVKVYTAQQFGAKGVLIYSDPADDQDHGKPAYPAGPARPPTGVQRGSVQFLPIYPGDPTTPGIASVPGLAAAKRIPASKLQYDLPDIPAQPLSSADATPILRALDGPTAPPDWQGSLGFPYRLGSGSVTVHLRLTHDTRLRTIWDVIGKIPGTTDARHWVVAGNHRDAWVYGATDPNSGTAAMLETVHGLGVLLAEGWRPKRTIVIGSWDAEEEGMIGSTEWVEQHVAEMQNAAAYFNIDEAVAGPIFSAAAVPSLGEFIRQIAEEVPSAAGGTVAQQVRAQQNKGRADNSAAEPPNRHFPVGDLGSGSDYTPFLQHAGVPSTDITSDGPFGVYHSVFDNFDWFTRFADPTFAYTQQQARFLGLELLHMADADVLPYDYLAYSKAVQGYLDRANTRATSLGLKIDFAPALAAAARFSTAAQSANTIEQTPPHNTASLNVALIATEHALLIPEGLPRRPWYRHSIYAPGEFTGYEAVVIPGVNEAIDTKDAGRGQQQLDVLAAALNRAATVLSAPAQ
jgi:N-acetylated-alpha-linked acidic dipeptidase